MSVVLIADDQNKAPQPLRAAVIEAGARFTASQYRLVKLVAELEQSNEWVIDGAPTCAHWVAGAVDVEVCTAREWLRIGRALAELDLVDRAFAEGRISYSKVRAVTRLATPETQAELCALAERVPAGRLRIALASWLAGRETPDETRSRQMDARGIWPRLDVDGTIAGWFRFDPLAGGTLMSSLDAQLRRHRPDASADASGVRWPTLPQQRADALIALVRGGGIDINTEVVLHVRGDGCTLDDGTPIAGSLVERIAPEAFLRVLIHDAESTPINASGRHRHPTARQRRVVHERDRVCVDCGSHELLEYDHDPPFEESKRTLVEELKPRCGPCHYRRTAERRKRAGGGPS